MQHRLVGIPDWDYTAENRLLFQRDYSTRFYRWVQSLAAREWRVARMRRGDAPASVGRRLRGEAGRLLSRGMVEILRRVPGEKPLPPHAISESAGAE